MTLGHRELRDALARAGIDTSDLWGGLVSSRVAFEEIERRLMDAGFDGKIVAGVTTLEAVIEMIDNWVAGSDGRKHGG